MQVPDMPHSLRIGCCGSPLSLLRYAEEFSVAEVQQTFYHPPGLRTLEKWRSTVPAGFEFALKAWQLITHEASSPTYRRLREELSPQQRREAGAFRQNPTVMYAWRRTLECARWEVVASFFNVRRGFVPRPRIKRICALSSERSSPSCSPRAKLSQSDASGSRAAIGKAKK